MHAFKLIIFLLVFCPTSNFVYGQIKSLPIKLRDTVLPQVDSLKAAIVIGTLRPRMKGDTVEYNVGHLGMRPNAVVEELLRRLPGLHIGPDGTMTYNGEKIEHLLVDGEDVFGSSPTLVTRTFDASKIARVQILDRKNDQAILTGIDDGTRTKTLNLVVKESAKDGYFGKMEVAGNTDGYYNVNAALAAFRRKEQFTALTFTSNTGTTGFSDNAGAMSIGGNAPSGNTDALGASAGIGVPRIDAAAFHYVNTWNGLLNHLSANYQYGHYVTVPVTITQTLQTQSDGIYGENQRSQSFNRLHQNWVEGIYDWTSTSKSVVKFTFHGNKTLGQNQYDATGSSTFNDTEVNSSHRTIRDDISSRNIGGNIGWRIGMDKSSDRKFSISIGATKVDNLTNGYLYSINQFYQPGGEIQHLDTTDQRKSIGSHSLSIGISINYVGPIGRRVALGLSYGAYYTKNESLQGTYARGVGKYQELIDSLSGHYRIQTVNQRAIISLQGKVGKLNYTLGTDWLGYSYFQRDLMAGLTSRLNNNNFAPRLALKYTPNQATNFGFNYNMSEQQPELSQLTLITNNSDPLHITLGNPNLKLGIRQKIRLEFHRFKTWQVNIALIMNLTSNSTSTKVATDSLGRQISQPINVNGDRTAGSYLTVNRSLLGFDLGFQATATYARTMNYINTALSRNDAYAGGGGFSLGKFVAKKYSFQLSTNFAYFDQVSNINTNAPVHYWTQSHQGMVATYLIPKFEVGTSATYTWQEKTSTFTSNTSVLLWNGYVARNFLHDKLVARFQYNNILNANAGITRTNTGNINTQSSTNILGRYWMISAVYHFDKKFKK